MNLTFLWQREWCNLRVGPVTIPFGADALILSDDF